MSAKNLKKSTQTSTKSKPSTGSDTNTKNKRWIRFTAPSTDLFEINRLLDLYWGGSERRLTGLTLRIMAVNAIALLTLMIGLIYLGQYQERLIETRLQNFEIELDLVSASLSQVILEHQDNQQEQKEALQNALLRMGASLDQNIFVYDMSAKLLAERQHVQHIQRSSLQSLEVLKTMGKTLLELLPDRLQLPPYPHNAVKKPDLHEALNTEISVSVWQGQQTRFFISAAQTLYDPQTGDDLGAVLMTQEAVDIENDINRVWIDVLKIFAMTLIITTLLSIYLSGVIARPLKKLARAAEDVRKGKSTADEIPDLSSRHDEIGELSLVLKQMTHALWSKMDATERFAADVAHELKNPLTSLRSAIETLGIVKKAPDRKKLMGVITHDIDRLDRLITDISNASRLDSELSRETFQTLSLKSLLHNLLDAYKDPLEREKAQGSAWDSDVKINGVRVNLKSAILHDIQISGIESRLLQVFENILSNALSFAPESSEISILIHDFAKKTSIVFEDQGSGIPEKKLGSIFERFYSERPDHEDYGHHSGLGLSICKQIIEAHGGQIRAENIKNKQGEIKGARFTVELNKA